MSKPIAMLVLSAGVLSALGAVPSAHAAAGDVPPSQTIRIGRGELESRAGIAGVHRRLVTAARTVCSGFESREPDREALFRRCVSEALARAVADVHDAGLTAYHERRTGAVLTARR